MAREPVSGLSAPTAIAPYALGVGILVLAITSQYFVPQSWPASRLVYRSLAGDLAIVYGIPVVAFALLVGAGPLRGWRAEPRQATIAGLGWYGLLGLLALVVTIVLTAVFLAVDPAAVRLLSKPNPDVEVALGDPWLYVALSFVVGAFEETIFRGWVFGFWVARGTPWLAPAILSSLLFAGLHLYYGTTYGWASLILFPTLFLLGFAFAATYRSARGNLVVPAVLHGAYDASAYVAIVSLGAGLAFRYGLIVVGAIVGLVYYLDRSSGPSAPSDPWVDAGVAAPPRSSTEASSPAPMAPSDEPLRRALTEARTIAVVGLSENPERDSNEVARYLQGEGYRIVPVNPTVPEVLGERSYPSLSAIPLDVRVDLALVFRRGDAVPPIVDEAIARGVPTVWMQLGVENAGAAAKARAHGLLVVENTCARATHRRLGIPPIPSLP